MGAPRLRPGIASSAGARVGTRCSREPVAAASRDAVLGETRSSLAVIGFSLPSRKDILSTTMADPPPPPPPVPAYVRRLAAIDVGERRVRTGSTVRSVVGVRHVGEPGAGGTVLVCRRTT